MEEKNKELKVPKTRKKYKQRTKNKKITKENKIDDLDKWSKNIKKQKEFLKSYINSQTIDEAIQKNKLLNDYIVTLWLEQDDFKRQFTKIRESKKMIRLDQIIMNPQNKDPRIIQYLENDNLIEEEKPVIELIPDIRVVEFNKK